MNISEVLSKLQYDLAQMEKTEPIVLTQIGGIPRLVQSSKSISIPYIKNFCKVRKGTYWAPYWYFSAMVNDIQQLIIKGVPEFYTITPLSYRFVIKTYNSRFDKLVKLIDIDLTPIPFRFPFMNLIRYIMDDKYRLIVKTIKMTKRNYKNDKNKS